LRLPVAKHCCYKKRCVIFYFYQSLLDEQLVIKHKTINMKKNMGNTDRIIQLLLAAVFIALYFTQTVTGTVGIVLLVLGIIFALTSAISFCPLYTLIGINTCPAKK
jgi:hypothetical protein